MKFSKLPQRLLKLSKKAFRRLRKYSRHSILLLRSNLTTRPRLPSLKSPSGIVVLTLSTLGIAMAFNIYQLSAKEPPTFTAPPKVSFTMPEPYKAPKVISPDKPCDPKDIYYVNKPGKKLSIFSEKSDKSTVLASIAHGEDVKAGCLDGVWLKVVHGKIEGYAMSDSLSKEKLASEKSSNQPGTNSSDPGTDGNSGGSGGSPPPTTPPPAGSTLRVNSVSVSVSPQSSSSLPIFGCSQDFTFTATLNSSGSGKVSYRWERSDNVTKAGNINITSSQQTTRYTWKVNKTSSGVLRLRITSPNQVVSNEIGYNFFKLPLC